MGYITLQTFWPLSVWYMLVYGMSLECIDYEFYMKYLLNGYHKSMGDGCQCMASVTASVYAEQRQKKNQDKSLYLLLNSEVQ